MAKSSGITDKITKLLAVVGIVAIAFVLNPSADKHRRVIKETIAERSQVDKIFGVGHLTAFASKYHNLFVASYTTVDDDVQSVGIFGIVFVME